FEDQMDGDDDGVPDGCDEIPDGNYNPTNATNATNATDAINATDANSENTTDAAQVNSTQSANNNSNLDVTQPSTELDSKTDASSRTPQLVISFVLMFSGAWLLFYLVGQHWFSKKNENDNIKVDMFFRETGIQDSTAQFAQISSMIDLPALNPPLEPTPFVQSNQPTPPPLPAEGLPAGWTMEQWNFYGQQWLEAQ
ncbi:MAG: hypothetical protein NLN65_07805, partial [Candidatus Poseidoniaceae archaeon]|nr:hypothetical protein [Candidatus Poseidoniaceae archaeon]